MLVLVCAHACQHANARACMRLCILSHALLSGPVRQRSKRDISHQLHTALHEVSVPLRTMQCSLFHLGSLAVVVVFIILLGQSPGHRL